MRSKFVVTNFQGMRLNYEIITIFFIDRNLTDSSLSAGISMNVQMQNGFFSSVLCFYFHEINDFVCVCVEK